MTFTPREGAIMTSGDSVICAVALAVISASCTPPLAESRGHEAVPPGPSGGRTHALAVLPSNPYYFQDARRHPVVLVGDYTWGTFSDLDFDYVCFLDSLRSRGLNTARVWLWWGCEEITTDPIPARHVEPFLRPGPGTANDGRPKYDLSRFNPVFFERLQAFCRAAQQRDIQLQLIMMDAWMLKHAELWKLHAFHRDNNINGVDGDPAHTGTGVDGARGFCSLGNRGDEVPEGAGVRVRRRQADETGSAGRPGPGAVVGLTEKPSSDQQNKPEHMRLTRWRKSVFTFNNGTRRNRPSSFQHCSRCRGRGATGA